VLEALVIDGTSDLAKRGTAMTGTVTPGSIPTRHLAHLGHFGPETCTDPDQHDRSVRNLSIIIENGGWTHPSFDRLYDDSGQLTGVATSMRCGCQLLGYLVL
jgi:hypothetical protein